MGSFKVYQLLTRSPKASERRVPVIQRGYWGYIVFYAAVDHIILMTNPSQTDWPSYE